MSIFTNSASRSVEEASGYTAAVLDLLGARDPFDVLRCSGKTGTGVDEILTAIVDRIPPPTGDPAAPLRALVYNSHFDTYKGVVVYVRVIDGAIKKEQRIKLMRDGKEYVVTDIGIFRPGMTPGKELTTGQVGYFTAQIKDIADVHIGDTVTDAFTSATVALPGYKEPKPMVYSGLYPVNNEDFETLREELAKLRLNDASFVYQPEISEGLGFGSVAVSSGCSTARSFSSGSNKIAT